MEEEEKRNENTEIKLPSIATAVKLNPKEMKDGAEKFQLSFWGFIWNLWMKLVSYCEIHAQTNNTSEIDIFYTEVVFWYFTMSENLSSQNFFQNIIFSNGKVTKNWHLFF